MLKYIIYIDINKYRNSNNTNIDFEPNIIDSFYYIGCKVIKDISEEINIFCTNK